MTETKSKIKSAVKEALQEKSFEDLKTQLTNLSTQVASGFAAVHTRQDTTNGKVLKNQEDLELFKKNYSIDMVKIDSKDRYNKIVWFLFTALVGAVIFFLTKGH